MTRSAGAYMGRTSGTERRRPCGSCALTLLVFTSLSMFKNTACAAEDFSSLAKEYGLPNIYVHSFVQALYSWSAEDLRERRISACTFVCPGDTSSTNVGDKTYQGSSSNVRPVVILPSYPRKGN